MKTIIFLVALMFATMSVPSVSCSAEVPKPESIAEKMSFKLVRGVTNVVTAVGELPKQTMLTAETHGNIGYVVGPIKGVGMTFYRAFIGLAETVFFMVPQPGYYDPMMEPEFVWHGWSSSKAEVTVGSDGAKTSEPGEVKPASEGKGGNP